MIVNVYAQKQDSKKLNITIYNQDFGLIQEIRSLSVPEGQSQIRLNGISHQVIPGSILIRFDGEVIDQTYHQQTANLSHILKTYFLNKKIDLVGNSGRSVSGILTAITGGQAVIQKKDGTFAIIPNVFSYQLNVDQMPAGATFNPYLECSIKSKKKGKTDFDLSYQTRGLQWYAIYSAVVNTSYNRMDLNADAYVRNYTGADYKNAHVNLMAGDINVQNRIPQPHFEAMAQVAKSTDQTISEKPFSDYHLYTISHPVDLPENSSKQLNLFKATNISIQRKYVYQSQNIGAAGKSSEGKIGVTISFINNKANHLDKPMPAGKVNIYKKDGKHLILIGQVQMGHTPAESHLKWNVGNAFDLTAKETLKKIKHISNRVTDRTYEIKFKNQQKKDVTIQVDRNIGSHGEVMDASQKYEKVDATTVRFEVPVKSKGEQTLSFTVRNSY